MEGQVAPRYPGSDAPSFGNGGVTGSGGGAGIGGGNPSVSASGVVSYEHTTIAAGRVSGGGVGGGAASGAAIGGGVGGGKVLLQQLLQQQQQTEECPICFMHYHGVNRTVCCAKPLCTECYLQVRGGPVDVWRKGGGELCVGVCAVRVCERYAYVYF